MSDFGGSSACGLECRGDTQGGENKTMVGVGVGILAKRIVTKGVGFDEETAAVIVDFSAKLTNLVLSAVDEAAELRAA